MYLLEKRNKHIVFLNSKLYLILFSGIQKNNAMRNQRRVNTETTTNNNPNSAQPSANQQVDNKGMGQLSVQFSSVQ